MKAKEEAPEVSIGMLGYASKLWRMDKERAGSGALGDLGSHIIDLGRFLVGEMKSVSAMTRTFIEEHLLPEGSGTGKVDVDDAFVATVEFESGAIGTLEGFLILIARQAEATKARRCSRAHSSLTFFREPYASSSARFTDTSDKPRSRSLANRPYSSAWSTMGPDKSVSFCLV